ncbi:MAG: DNA-binding response regulator [Deltaproteobacteria bacterium]|nr:MAG: DNA-binding response regulator [Deltaproteobacteria bacterium]
MYSILVVDDEPNYLVVLSELLKDENFEVFTASSAVDGLKTVKDVDLDVVITDMQMPGMNGLEFLQEIQKIKRTLPVIVITAFAEVEKAVEAMRLGAFNYLAKPFSNDELIVTINQAANLHSLLRENVRLRREITGVKGFVGMVGKNEKMLQIYQLIDKVAPTQASVLITGESGTGKELVAKAIHSKSTRESMPFITVNCANLSDSFLESDLFGHERGAFTGAVSMRKGRFELADGGTIFLDEVGEIPMALQAKLLRVLQERTFERVGGGKTLEVDVRIISATNKDLREEVLNGRFREDLFYRLNVIPISLPALRERMDDMCLLVDYFLEKFQQQLGKDHLRVSEDALKLLMKLPWEGNIRELENTIERAAILCSKNTIEAEDVQPDILYGEDKGDLEQKINLKALIPENTPLNEVLYSIEKKMLLDALDAADNVQAQAAEALGITRSLLQYKMKKYRIKKK